MARLFVGQRVRVNCPTSEVHGVECRIEGEDIVYDSDCLLKGFGYAVDIPWTLEPDDNPQFEGYAFLPSELEPILPAHQPVAIADLLSEFPSLSNALGVVA